MQYGIKLPSLYPSERKRKPFSLKTKKIEWMRAAGRDPYGKFIKTSRCRRCKRKLIWGDGTYNFDHKDNNPANNSQRNCYLVCRNCHGRVTKLEKRKVREPITGVVSYKTIKRKVGYKKSRKKKPKKRKRRRKTPLERLLWGKKE